MVEVITIDSQIVLGRRAIGPYELISKLIGELFQYAFSNGAEIAGPPIFVCHEISAEDAERANREGNANIEVALPIAKRISGSEEITCYELTGGQMAKVVHKGPYDGCNLAYEELFSWIYQNGKNVIGHTREVYLNDPSQVAPDELLTEIYAPVS
ncbi:MAG: GyrI-like domain-containing protein [Chloroflexota bacterium]|nr:GyrI-like domain-containing protein [Chloroflexota bacterium]